MKYRLEMYFEYEVETDDIDNVLQNFYYPDFCDAKVEPEFLSNKNVYEVIEND